MLRSPRNHSSRSASTTLQIATPTIVFMGPDQVAATLSSQALRISGPLTASWNSTTTSSFTLAVLTASHASVLNASGNLFGHAWSGWRRRPRSPPLSPEPMGSASPGTGELAFYGSAESSLGVSPNWNSYSATVSGGGLDRDRDRSAP